MRNLELSWEQVKELIPEKIWLEYVDYRESFDDSEKLLQEVISNGNWDHIYDLIDDWYREQRWRQEDWYINELRSDIVSKYDCDELDAEAITDAYEDEIKETLWDRNDSDVLKDLINNTGRFIAHYDTGYYMESESWSWDEARVRLERYAIKKHLGILHTSYYDDELDMMIRQASYGGQLLIFFNLDLDDFIGDKPERNTIKFTDAMIGVVDHHNGSGDVLGIPIKEEIVLPYNRENVFLEKSIKYNWTYSIAGMCHDWADSTSIEFSKENQLGEIEKSKINAHLEREAEYNKTFKEGGCTFGDMDITRHRNTPYRNDFPCGNTCTKCGTFWID